VIDLSRSPGPPLAADKSGIAFRAWLRQLVSGVAELEAFDAGEVDAVMDRGSGRALLLPEAQIAVHDVNRQVLSTLDALPGEVCALDASGVVVLANKAWRLSGATHARAGLDVRAGENIFAACRDAPENERTYADAIVAGLRDVFGGIRLSLRVRYVCRSPRGRSAFTLTMAATSAQGPVNALLTREWHDEPTRPERPRGRGATRPSRTTTASRATTENQLLAALPSKDYARLASGLEPVTVTSGEVLYEPGERIREVYFPDNCVLSLLTVIEGHRALEVGLVGREGMIGARLALGATQSSVRVLVHSTGTAMRMGSARFLREFRRSQTLHGVLLQFTSKLMDQISQTAACNRFHVVEERLARCLLMTAARTRSAEFQLTHGFLADMLGVRREGVTVAAIALQRRGLIRYRRGNITILDHQGLEAASCSCYRHLQVLDSESLRSTSTG
jgi:CRP-like cAMP-binding protein